MSIVSDHHPSIWSDILLSLWVVRMNIRLVNTIQLKILSIIPKLELYLNVYVKNFLSTSNELAKNLHEHGKLRASVHDISASLQYNWYRFTTVCGLERTEWVMNSLLLYSLLKRTVLIWQWEGKFASASCKRIIQGNDKLLGHFFPTQLMMASAAS